MRRGTALLLGAAVMAAARLVPAGADTTPAPAPTPDLPRSLCSHGVTDIDKDAVPAYAPPLTLAGTTVDDSAVFHDNPALDIRAVNLRLTSTDLEVFMGLQGDPTKSTMAAYDGSWRYEVSFTLNGKNFDYGLDQDNTADPGKELVPASTVLWKPMASAGSTPVVPKSTGKFVSGATANDLSWVVLTSPRAEVEKAVGPITDGVDVFKSISGFTYTYAGSNVHPTVDLAQPSGPTSQYVAGDDWCFGPPPTSLSSLTVPAATYHHAETMSAVLQDQDGKPLVGKPVTFTINAPTPVTAPATTDTTGLAKATFTSITLPAGSYPVTATFPGEDTTLKTSSVTGTLKVSAQKTVFTALKIAKASATTRTVTTTLLDDLKKPIAGVRVDWYVNGKKTTSSTTDKTGKVVLKGAKPGQKVQARYAGKVGYWLASVSSIAKVA